MPKPPIHQKNQALDDLLAQQEREKVVGHVVTQQEKLPISDASAAELAERTIEDKYNQLGGRFSRLGRRASATVVSSDGATFDALFRGGRITFTTAGGARAFATHKTIVRYRGMHCFGKSEAVDEPYALVGVYLPDSRENVRIRRFPSSGDSYDDVVAGTSRSETENIFEEEAPQTLVISCTVMEYDSGDPEKVKSAFALLLKKAGDAAVAAAGVPALGAVVDLLIDPLADFGTGLFGLDDDVIGSQVLTINVNEQIPKRPMREFGNIKFNFESPLLENGDASYKLYFEVWTELLPVPVAQ